MLQTKCIFASAESMDGLRISVMSRHTADDGKTKDPRFYQGIYDEWRPTLAPPLKLVGALKRGEIDWAEFADNYNEHLNVPQVDRAIQELLRAAMESNVTIMCAEEAPENCHRRLIAEKCQLIVPSLEVVVS